VAKSCCETKTGLRSRMGGMALFLLESISCNELVSKRVLEALSEGVDK